MKIKDKIKNIFYIDGYLFGRRTVIIDGVKIRSRHTRKGFVIMSAKDSKFLVAYAKLNILAPLIEKIEKIGGEDVCNNK